MSWSDTTPAPNMVGTHSYLAAVRRADGRRPRHCAVSLSNICLWEALVRPIIMTLRDAKSIAAGGGEVQPQGLVSLGTGLFVN